MSLLLKALEKSEEEKKEGADGGMKLSGGSGAAGQGSKLGSALASRPADTKAAGRVVAAYEHKEDAAEEDTVLVAASRRQINKRLVGVFFLAVIGLAGYYAYLEFVPDFLASQQVPTGVQQQATSTADTQAVQDPEDEQIRQLPLPEPIYDIQESILIASLDSNVPTETDEENIAQRVTNVVSSIIEEQEELERRRVLLAEAGIEEEESVEEEIEGILSQTFASDSAEKISTLDQMAMLSELDSLAGNVYESENFTIKPSSHVAAVVGEGAAASEQIEEPPAPAPAPQQTVSLTANKDKSQDLIDQGTLNYRYGNLDEAEKAFRTVIATQPTNVSALLGLAKVHQSRGNRKLALSTLLKAAEYSPNDPNIIGELISIQAENASSKVIEQRILGLLAKADNSNVRAKLLFALGNAYARDKSWIDARNSYRAAHALNANNPDYLYNLAVISDYMLDKKGALSYYQGAIDAARGNPSSFDHGVARNRIAELEGIL